MINQLLSSENQDKMPRHHHRSEPSVVEHTHFHKKKVNEGHCNHAQDDVRELTLITRRPLTDSSEELRQ